MKESLSAIPKQPVFRETFTDEQTTRLNGGTIETPITFTNGVANFTPSAKGVLYNFTPKLFSVRIKFSNRIVNAQDNYLFGSFTDTKYVLILNNNNIYGGLASWSAVYINGVASTSLGTLTSGEITVTGFSNYTATSFRVGGKNTVGLGFEGSLELVEIYDYTLTANEVKNLYEGKRNRIIDLKQTAPSIDNYYQGVGVVGNFLSSPIGSVSFANDFTLTVQGNPINATGGELAGANNISFAISTIGGLRFFANSVQIASTVATTFTDKFYRVSRSGNNWIFSTSTDGITFTQLGATVVNSVVITNGTTIRAGNGGGSLDVPINGKIKRVMFYNDSNATTLIADCNPATYNASTSQTAWTSSTGEVWTINGTQGFIGNGSRPEILNIDGRNGVIANKYSNQPLLPNLASGYNITNWTTTGTAVLVNATTFNLPLAGDTVYKSFGQASKYLRIRIQGTTTGSVLVKSGDGSIVLSPNLTGTFDLNTDVVWSANGNVVFYAAIAGITTITNFTIQELIPNIVNTAVTPVRQGSVWGMDFNGSTSKLDCGNYDSLVGDVTFIAWYKAATLGSGSAGRIIDNGQMQIHSGGYFTRNSSTFINFISAWKLGIWTQVVITSTSTGLTNTYINGVLVGSANQNAGSPVAGSNNILLGNNNSSNR